MNQLKDITADIKSGNCILILGPDIIDFGEKSFFEAMCDELISNGAGKSVIDTAPQYIFVNEELLQLMPNAKETTLLRMMDEFYQKQTAFDLPFTKIAQIPFHLIISLMPDDRLQKIFANQNLDYNYAHYPREGTHLPVEKPSIEKPLLYNLLGDFIDKDAIITFDHLFEFLSGIMGKRELPDEIQWTLKSANSFIFLGVHFEKWYVQLILKIITSEKKENYIIQKSNSNADICTFVARRHQLDFLETDPSQFLDQLYNECVEKGIVKTSVQKSKASVFISYSSVDIEIAKKVEAKLKEKQIEVIRDEISTHAGQKIENFITTIKNVDSVLLIVSQNSLRSTWVSKEIIATLDNHKNLLTCYIDKSFLDYQFWEDLKVLAKNKVEEIGHKIIHRGTDSILDLEAEGNDWRAYNSNLPIIKNELNRGIAKSLIDDNFDATINHITEHIVKK